MSSEISELFIIKSLFCFSQNTYTATAINSTTFCTSAKDDFVILAKNALQVAAINTVGDFMPFLGKVCWPYAIVTYLCMSKVCSSCWQQTSLSNGLSSRYNLPSNFQQKFRTSCLKNKSYLCMLWFKVFYSFYNKENVLSIHIIILCWSTLN